MTKGELVAAMAESTGTSQAAAGAALDAAIDTIMATVANGEKVSLPGFATFERGHRAARQGRNLQTGETIQIAAANTVKIKAGSKFKEAVK